MTLLAKASKPDRKDVTLLSHTQDVLAAADALFGVTEPTALGRAWLRFFKLTDEKDFCKFRASLLAAVLWHDAGKANSDFQKAVREWRYAQVIRHEVVSGMLMAFPGVWDWLNKSRPDVDWDVVLVAVLTHHIKFEQERFGQPQTPLKMFQMNCRDGEFTVFAAWVAGQLNIPGAPAFPAESTWTFDPARPGQLEVLALADNVTRRLNTMRRIKKDYARVRLLRAVRAGLIAADAAGSGLTREGLDIPTWIANCFPTQPITPDQLEVDIIKKRLDQLRAIGKWKDDNGYGGWNTFQLNCDDYPARTLLLAPCGSGKTLAAWRWIKAQLAANPARRVIFLYPTRATATEGFKDYVSWAPEADAGLMHGTAEYDLADMFANAPDDRRHRDFQAESALYALGFWAKKYFSATVDQFFAFLHHQYKPTCMLPALADSILVVDECHSFDGKMFDSLTKFLKEFNVPTLCMTATLPPPRIKDLQAAGLHMPGNVMTKELEDVAGAPRYTVNVAEKDVCFGKAVAALKAGRRVLWVANRVAEAQETARRFRDHPDLKALPTICYHSRFTLEDRGAKHGTVVGLFKSAKPGEPPPPPAVAVSTQVCEMSLDMDADVVITERCPITALIQRMGRANRVMEPRPDAGEVWVYQTEKTKPYDEDDLAGVNDFLKDVAGRRTNQIELEELLREHGPKNPDPERTCLFVDDPLNANGRDEEAALRDIEQFSRPCVLDDDVDEYMTAPANKKPGYVVPVPKKFAEPPDPSPRNWPKHLAVAPAAHYDPDLGFCDQPVTA